MKQIALGMQMYAQDHDSVYPPRAPQDAGRSWDSLLYPYLKNERVFRCPNLRQPESGETGTARVRHYAVNANIYGKSLESPAKIAGAIRFPATTVSLCEVGYRVRESRTGRSWMTDWLRGTRREYRVPLAVTAPDRGTEQNGDGWKPLGELAALRHGDGSNYAFADGHVKWFRPEAVRDGGAPNDGKRPGFGL